MSEELKSDFWAIVEVMGHRRFAGLVGEKVIGGQSFVRIDIPECGPDKPAFTKLFGGASIYCISPVSEQLARIAAARSYVPPVSEYDLSTEWREKINARSLPAPTEKDVNLDGYDPDENDDDDYEVFADEDDDAMAEMETEIERSLTDPSNAN